MKTELASVARLTDNPFVAKSAREVESWVGFEEFKWELIDVIESCRTDRVGQSECVSIHGQYGSGKSHALKYLKYLITEKESSDFNSACIYLDTLKLAAKVNFSVIYCKIMEELTSHIQGTAEWLDFVVGQTAKKRLSNGSQEELVAARNNIFLSDEISPGFPALGLLLRDIHIGSRDALTILLGQALKGQDCEQRYLAYGLEGPIEADFDTAKCLSAYINLCTQGAAALGDCDEPPRNKAFYLFIDELESLLDLSTRESTLLNNCFRDLVNDCPENVCFLFAATSRASDIYGLLSTRLIERMTREPLELPTLEVEEAVEFLGGVLKAYRGDKSDPDEFPFEREALRAIVESSRKRTPEDLFRRCRRVLERANLAGALADGRSISAEMVAEYL